MLYEAMILVGVYFLIFFVFGTIKKNNSIVDFGWGLGFVIVAWYTLLRGGKFQIPGILTTILVTFWGVRLSWHIFKRNVGKPEDFRYDNWRKAWGKWVIIRSFFQIYVLQGIMMLLIGFPIVFTNNSDASGSWLLIGAGFSIWCVGYYFEFVGDAQLKKFKSDPANKGKLITTGLWGYTRHPNYFGEATMWWGIALIAIAMGNGVWMLISPIVITVLLRFVSGVPMLEESMKKRPGFEEYAKVTNAFVPKLRIRR